MTVPFFRNRYVNNSLLACGLHLRLLGPWAFGRSGGLVILACVAILVGCAKSSSPKAAAGGSAPVGEADREKFVSQFGAVTVSCAGNPNCPSHLGLLMFSSLRGRGRCTAQLISGDTIITNRHCLNDIPDGECPQRVAFMLVNDQGQGRVAYCKEVLAMGAPTDSRSDYAVVRLQRGLTLNSSGFVRVSGSGVAEGEGVVSHVIDARSASDDRDLIVTTRQCTAVFESVFSGFVSAPWGSTFVGSGPGCRFFPGNSGAPVINSKSEIVGLVYATTSMDGFSISIPSGFRSQTFRDDLRRLASGLGLFVSFACRDLPVLGLQADPQCGRYSAEAGTRQMSERLFRAFGDAVTQRLELQRFRSQAEAWTAGLKLKGVQARDDFSRALTQSLPVDLSGVFSWEPECINTSGLAAEADINNPMMTQATERLGWSLSPRRVLRLHIPEIVSAGDVGVDRLGRMVVRSAQVYHSARIRRYQYVWDRGQLIQGELVTLQPRETISSDLDRLRVFDLLRQALGSRSPFPILPLEGWETRVPTLVPSGPPERVPNLSLCPNAAP